MSDGRDQSAKPPSPAEREFVRGLELQRRGELDVARRAYARALAIDPRHRNALNNLGVALRSQGRLEAAVVVYRRALALDPDNPGLHTNLGNALRALARPQEALAHHQRAAELSPKDAGALHALGLTLRDLDRQVEAVRCFDGALQLAPGDARATADLGRSLIAGGDLARGFGYYEARRAVDGAPPNPTELPQWDGKPAKGRRLLLFDEGRDGDAILFARYIRRVAEAGAEVVVLCRPELARLLATAPGVARVIPRGRGRPEADLQAPLASVPALLGLTREDTAVDTPYLRVPKGAGPALERPKGVRLTVGLAWAGEVAEAAVSPGLAACLPLAARADAAFYALQKGPPAAELVETGAEGLVIDASGRIEDLADMAGAIARLDLTIAVGAPVAPLAAALGRPCWVVLPYAADWRWCIAGTDSPWFPDVRVFRQPRPADWGGAVAAVGEALDVALAAAGSGD